MVVYTVWDRVVRVRFPAPRQTQNPTQVFCVGFCCFRRSKKCISALLLGNEAPEDMFLDFTGEKHLRRRPRTWVFLWATGEIKSHDSGSIPGSPTSKEKTSKCWFFLYEEGRESTFLYFYPEANGGRMPHGTEWVRRLSRVPWHLVFCEYLEQ